MWTVSKIVLLLTLGHDKVCISFPVSLEIHYTIYTLYLSSTTSHPNTKSRLRAPCKQIKEQVPPLEGSTEQPFLITLRFKSQNLYVNLFNLFVLVFFQSFLLSGNHSGKNLLLKYSWYLDVQYLDGNCTHV